MRFAFKYKGFKFFTTFFNCRFDSFVETIRLWLNYPMLDSGNSC